jgi:hypothetical protein
MYLFFFFLLKYFLFSPHTFLTTGYNYNDRYQSFDYKSTLSNLYHSLQQDTIWSAIMRFTAAIAAAILAVTVSAAALPAAVAMAEAAPAAVAEEEFDIGKRDADAEPGWVPKWRPIGLPYGKRDAEADAEPGWVPKWRPIGLLYGKVC